MKLHIADNTIRLLVVGSFVSVMGVAAIDSIGNYSKSSCMQNALERNLKPKDIASECKRMERKSVISLF